jgi:hypothetical protein
MYFTSKQKPNTKERKEKKRKEKKIYIHGHELYFPVRKIPLH